MGEAPPGAWKKEKKRSKATVWAFQKCILGLGRIYKWRLQGYLDSPIFSLGLDPVLSELQVLQIKAKDGKYLNSQCGRTNETLGAGACLLSNFILPRFTPAFGPLHILSLPSRMPFSWLAPSQHSGLINLNIGCLSWKSYIEVPILFHGPCCIWNSGVFFPSVCFIVCLSWNACFLVKGT